MSSPKAQVSVVVSKNGPYVVSGSASLAEEVIVANTEGESLQWQRGEAYAVPEKYALCRCSHSYTPPFCDGTHAKVGFDGTETAARTPYAAQAKVFEGRALSLLDARHLCADARFCDPNGKVWNQVAHTGESKEVFVVTARYPNPIVQP
ncbi:MAG TPA: CDGSH iron-sulfur domain-containing protein [Xanthobacteraceae bacterium]